jgi:cell migration-inducing and hyaluronan-binding protein
MNKGSWVIFELPGFTKSAAGAQQSSLAALRSATDTSYFADGKELWVKLVVVDPVGIGGPGGPGSGGGAAAGPGLAVSR